MKHFARYVLARWEQSRREELYRAYVTDALKAISENTARPYGGNAMSKRMAELLSGATKEEDTRTIEDIKASIWAKIGS